MSVLRRLLIAGVVLTVVACGDGSAPADDLSSPPSIPPVTSIRATTTTAPPIASTIPDPTTGGLPMCHELHRPAAPDDWYADSPVYVGDEMPYEEVRRFVAGLPGYQDLWIDQRHNGWISVGFVDGDVAGYQAVLEEEFPGVGVVAVEMPYSHAQLDEVMKRIDAALPRDMNAYTSDTFAVVRVWVGRLTPEHIALVEEIAGSDPVCLEGLDPVRTPEAGPQQAEGDGWIYLAVADAGTERPTVVADAATLIAFWESLDVQTPPPSVDFDTHLAVSFTVIYSGSCPETRFDGIVIEADRVYPVIPHLSTDQACTSDANARTYLVAIDRDRLPEPPFRMSHHKESLLETRVTADLRRPGSVPAEDEIVEITRTRERTATRTPLLIETKYPWPITIDLSCGIEYLGIINGVGWYDDDAVEIPAEWEKAAADGLLDVVILIEEGPEPTLTVSAAGQDIVYLPGPRNGVPCG